MSLLVFGKTGQVARALAGAEGATCLGRDAADLSDPEACAEAIRAARPRAVINAAAYTAVDRAEEEEALAHTVNAEAPATMARACAALGIPFVTISTDYVFDGSGEAPRAPGEATGPLSAYGRTKRAGERAVAEIIAEAGGAHAILRTTWVFAPGGKNFVTTMLRLGAERDRLTIVADQVGGPTPAGAIAEACLIIAERLAHAPEASGIYHFSGAPDVSWADFARAIFAEAGLSCVVEDIPTSAYPTPARRPLNSRLDCSATEAVFGIARPDWRAALPAVIAAYEG
ncbi:MAG: dTDP-4-dehydrorhamnose reductase [Roseovarius sp.]